MVHSSGGPAPGARLKRARRCRTRLRMFLLRVRRAVNWRQKSSVEEVLEVVVEESEDCEQDRWRAIVAQLAQDN